MDSMYKVADATIKLIKKGTGIDWVYESYQDFLVSFNDAYTKNTEYTHFSSAAEALRYGSIVIHDTIRFNADIMKAFDSNYQYYLDTDDPDYFITPPELKQNMEDTEAKLLAFYDKNLTAYEKIDTIVKETKSMMPRF